MLTLPQEHQTLLAPVARVLAEQGIAAWLVGGYVRDLLLDRASDDIDVAVDGPALQLARAIADQTGGAFVELDDATQSARIVWKRATQPISDIEGFLNPQPSAFSLQPSAFSLDLVRLRAPTINDDLRLRDVTINALAVPLGAALQAAFTPHELVDPTDGSDDLQQRVVRPCGPTTFSDDPLRMLRAVRFAAQLSFELAPETDLLIRQNVALIDTVAHERVRDELLKLLAQRHAARWIIYLDTVRLLTRIIGELEPARNCVQPREHFLPVLDHLLETVRAWEWLYDQIEETARTDQPEIRPEPPLDRAMQPVAVQTHPQISAPLPFAARIVGRMHEPLMAGHRRYTLFKLATLLHDVAKPQTKQIGENGRVTFYDHQVIGAEVAGRIGQRLRLSREAIGYIQLVIREHMRPGQLNALGDELTMRAVYRFGRDTRAAAPDVLLHALCDHLAVRGPMLSVPGWAQHVAWTGDMLEALWTPQREAQRERLLTGKDLMEELHLQPGPIIGEILEAVAEAHFLGTIHTREEALALARQTADEVTQRGAT
jgi:poly(A) polymerase/tRNA nucleotidyltransferase (CCA-adding enzyme)